MMKTGMVAIIAFAAGAGTCWMIKPSTQGIWAGSATPSGTLPTKSGNERPSNPDERQRIDSLLSQLTEGTQPVFLDEEEDLEPEHTIDVEDYPKLLEALQQRAGISGLSGTDQSAFEQLLGDWYVIDPVHAANWVRGLKNANDRRELGENLIGIAAKSNYDEAIRLMQDLSIRDDGGLLVPDSLVEAAASRGAEELLRLCSMSVGVDDATGASALSYPPDFDFRTALEGFNGLKAKGVSLANYPVNLLEEWTKLDPEAAMRWYATQGSEKARGTSLSTYFTNLALSGSVDELASKVAIAASIAGPKDHILEDIGSGLGNGGFADNPLVLSQILSKLPDGLDQTGLRTALMESTTGSGRGAQAATFRESLLNDLEPGERISLLQAIFANKEETHWEEESLDSLKQSLIKLGHPEKQIAELLPTSGVRVGVFFPDNINANFIREDGEPEEDHGK